MVKKKISENLFRFPNLTELKKPSQAQMCRISSKIGKKNSKLTEIQQELTRVLY